MAEQVIVAQSVPVQKQRRSTNRELYATVAYHYPQYTLKQIAKLPYRDVRLLLETADRIEADRYLTLTHIVTAPHTQKGVGVKNLIEYFKKIING